MTTPLARALSGRARAWMAAESAAEQGAPPERLYERAGGIIDLSSDELVGTTPEPVRAGAVAALDKHLGDHYTRRPGLLPLCNAVAEILAADDMAIDAENGVLITGNIAEARFIAFSALAAGKVVYLPAPALLADYSAAALGANASLQPFDPNGELPSLDPNGVLLFPNPNSATGRVYPLEIVQRVANWAMESNLITIADEALAPLVRPGVAFTRPASLPGMAERTLTLGSFRGIPGLVPWSVSWIAGPNELAAPARNLKLAISLCSPAVSQQAALAGIKSGEAHAAANATGRIEQLEKLLQQHGISYLEPHTVVYIVADVSALGGGDAAAAACAQRGVRITSGAALGMPSWIRITTASDRFQEGVERLDAVFASLRKERAS